MNKVSALVAAGFLTLVWAPGLTGCAKDRGYVQREWSTTMRELGIVPVFPPREDVFVGDVYGYRINPEGREADKLLRTKWARLGRDERVQRMNLGMSPRLYRLNLNEHALEEYQNTLAAPATPDEYNRILGNQALAAAQEQLATAQAALKAAKALLKVEQDKLKAAETALLQAERSKANADIKLTDARALLKRAETKAPDTSAEETAVANEKAAVRSAEKDVRVAQADLATAQANLARLASDDPQRPAAQTAVYTAEDAKRSADVRLAQERAELKEAEADLTAKKAERPELKEAQIQVATAEDDQRQKAFDVVEKTRARDDQKRALAEATTAAAPDLEKKEKAVSDAQGAVNTIKSVGEKLLYSQPRDAERDVFTANELPERGLADDLRNARINRLRLVGFPEFSSTTFSQGDLSALIPIEAFNLGLNASSADASRVTVKVPAAESYAVPISALITAADYGSLADHRAQLESTLTEMQQLCDEIKALEASIAVEDAQDENTQGDDAPGVDGQGEDATPSDHGTLPASFARARAQDGGENTSPEPGEDNQVDDSATQRVMEEIKTKRADYERLAERARSVRRTIGQIEGSLVTEFGSEGYALHPAVKRAIQLQFFSNKGVETAFIRVPTEVYYARALDVSVFYSSAYGVRARLSLLEQAQALSGNNTAGTATTPLRSGSAQGAQLLQGVESSLGQSMNVPGGSVQLMGFNERSVGLRRVFDRPVAIGFRGLTLKVCVKTGTVIDANPISGPTPSLVSGGTEPSCEHTGPQVEDDVSDGLYTKASPTRATDAVDG